MSGPWLWAVLTVLAVVAAVAVVLLLTGRRPGGDRRAGREAVLAALALELAAIDRQLAEGRLAPAEAAAREADLRRRLGEEADTLAVTPADASGAGRRPRAWLAVVLAVAVVPAVAVLSGRYGWMDRPDVVGRASGAGGATTEAARPAESPDGAGKGVRELLARLEARLQANPADPEGWRMLGWSRFELGDYGGAAEAYARAVALAPRNALYLSALGEAQVMASAGEITPAARASFRRALEVDPADARARYYLAAARDQDGDTRGAIDAWLGLVAEDPAAPWVAELRTIILARAKAAGIDVSARLPPPASAALPRDRPGPPTADQIAEASAMSPADRQAMIRGMVDGLEARLGENPLDLAGWQRLIRARMVLGEKAKARAAYSAARQALAGSPADLRALERFARELNLPGA